MRYLFTYDATREHGGVKFAPVTRSGGQLFGTASVDETQADAVLFAGGTFVKEISEEDYLKYEKKKLHLRTSRDAFQIQNLSEQFPRPATAAGATSSKRLSPALLAESVLKPVKL